MSPILLRPIREQLEHDRVIRQLQTRWRRRFEVGINVGNNEGVSVRSGERTCYPDLVLTNITGGRRLHGVVEVETAESVNHLEAMAEWTHFSQVRGAFYLYVPAGFTDVALRLCQASRVNVTEIWAYYAIDAQAKFSLAYRSPRAKQGAKAAKTVAAKRSKTSGKPAARKSTAKKKSTRGTSSSKSKLATATKSAAARKRAKTGATKVAKAAKKAPTKRTAAKKVKTKPKSKAKTTAKVRVKKTKATTVTKRSTKATKRR